MGTYSYYYISDALGSTWQVWKQGSNSAAFSVTSYWPFGTPYTPSGTEKVKFAGEVQDSPTGFYYLCARYYDPTLGRFVSLDPELGKLSSPQTLNRYVYCVNNPPRFTDQTGERGGGHFGHPRKCAALPVREPVIIVAYGHGHGHPYVGGDELPIWIDPMNGGQELVVHGIVTFALCALGSVAGSFSFTGQYIWEWASTGEGSIGGLNQNFMAGYDYGTDLGYYVATGQLDSILDLERNEYLANYEYLKDNYDKFWDKTFDNNWDLKKWWSPRPTIPMFSSIAEFLSQGGDV